MGKGGTIFQMSTVVCTQDGDSAHLLVASACLDGERSPEQINLTVLHFSCIWSNGWLFHKKIEQKYGSIIHAAQATFLIAAHLVKQSNSIDVPKYL